MLHRVTRVTVKLNDAWEHVITWLRHSQMRWLSECYLAICCQRGLPLADRRPSPSVRCNGNRAVCDTVHGLVSLSIVFVLADSLAAAAADSRWRWLRAWTGRSVESCRYWCCAMPCQQSRSRRRFISYARFARRTGIQLQQSSVWCCTWSGQLTTRFNDGCVAVSLQSYTSTDFLTFLSHCLGLGVTVLWTLDHAYKLHLTVCCTCCSLL